MVIVNPGSRPTNKGMKMLSAIKDKPADAKEISEITGLPVSIIRGGLRELIQIGLVEVTGEIYSLTEEAGLLLEEEGK